MITSEEDILSHLKLTLPRVWYDCKPRVRYLVAPYSIVLEQTKNDEFRNVEGSTWSPWEMIGVSGQSSTSTEQAA